MAWRPYTNLIRGELDNRTPGTVTGWMHFVRHGKDPLEVTFDLTGDFHEDIRGTVIRLSNQNPSDHGLELGYEGGTYMDGFAAVQRGSVGDITAGLPLGSWTDDLAQRLLAQLEAAWERNNVPSTERKARRESFVESAREHINAGDLYHSYVDYPYIEWYSDNGRVVLELEPSQIEVLRDETPLGEKTPAELAEADAKRAQAFGEFMSDMVRGAAKANRESGGDGNVTGVVV
jgi:hypothetical protein